MTRLHTAPGLRIGLLGGSFNPAHEGHLHIARVALQRLNLDQVWWLVSPQNPLKSESGMAPLEKRLARAREVADDPRIAVTAIEEELGTRYTADTLVALKRRFPGVRFVWLMGADNMIELPRWKNWRAIMRAVPVAVIARPAYTIRARVSRAALIFASARKPTRAAPRLAAMPPPAWVLIEDRLHPASATRIRERGLWP